MSALEYRCRKGLYHLRMVAYHPLSEPGDNLKVVVQVVHRGTPIAEDPIHVERMTPLDLAFAIHHSRMDGWELTPWRTND